MSSPVFFEIETICMKCQILFSEENKRNISACSRLKNLNKSILLPVDVYSFSISNFQPIRLLDPDCYYKFKFLMANSADPDQLASAEAN